MALIEGTLNGKITLAELLTGNLSKSVNIRGSTEIPKVLDRTAIHYDTTEAWNSETSLIAQAGHFYVYSDYTRREKDDGTVELIPALKIGDGTSYLIDMPFSVIGNAQEVVDHINNASIHVSTLDRSNWDDKVSVLMDDEAENLTLCI